MPSNEFQVGNIVTFRDNPRWEEGVVRLVEGGNIGVEFPFLEGRGPGHNLRGTISNENGWFIYFNDLIFIRKKENSNKYAHKKCKGLIVCKSCRKKEMEF